MGYDYNNYENDEFATLFADYPEVADLNDERLNDSIWQHSKSNRAPALLEMQQTEYLCELDSARLTLAVWQGVEFPVKQWDTWEGLWQNYKTPPEQSQRINALFSKPRTVYRGGSQDGWSWTLNPEQARWFAVYRGGYSKMILEDDDTIEALPVGLWSKVVSADAVLAVLDSEREVILKYDPYEPNYYGTATSLAA
tara:strand:- start:1681 stop:2268 length:588 start_codon:yes stop_codon:yes gene_type:complete